MGKVRGKANSMGGEGMGRGTGGGKTGGRDQFGRCDSFKKILSWVLIKAFDPICKLLRRKWPRKKVTVGG